MSIPQATDGSFWRHDFSALLLGAWVLGQSVWILFVRRESPLGAVTATRRSRTIIAAASGLFAIVFLFFRIQSLV
ncbi:hypothetical protein [Sphingomonas crusticola]|uniref:hypothetical protein n=1 Tax=Sphingomonas crusticola TaxID=1697973 RepID=UPI000E266543|nr:hypothetical protein [Sphingomonas crusticola]